jgi:hypothetical protein
MRLEDSLEKRPVAGGDASPLEEVERQAAAWASLAGRWESSATIQEEIDALYKARSKGRKVDL